MARDKALITARSVLRGQICECGCLEGEHRLDRRYRPDSCYECDCVKFKAVAFTVERKTK